MRIADFLRHDAQAYGVPGAPSIERILEVCVEAANWIDNLENRLAQAERERDAAVSDLRGNYEPCDVCKKKNICEQYCPQNDYDCNACLDIERCIFHNCTKDNDLWQWRGICEENSK